MLRSAGILLYRNDPDGPRVLLGHLGGPFWANRDEHAWTVPKGEFDDPEDARTAAVREFTEELGSPPPDGELVELGTFRQSGGKRVTVFALAGDLDADAIVSNTFELEWPPRSGRIRSFPEIDRAAWFDLATARRKLVKGQLPVLSGLEQARIIGSEQSPPVQNGGQHPDDDGFHH